MCEGIIYEPTVLRLRSIAMTCDHTLSCGATFKTFTLSKHKWLAKSVHTIFQKDHLQISQKNTFLENRSVVCTKVSQYITWGSNLNKLHYVTVSESWPPALLESPTIRCAVRTNAINERIGGIGGVSKKTGYHHPVVGGVIVGMQNGIPRAQLPSFH